MEFDPFDPSLARLQPQFSAGHAKHIRQWLDEHEDEREFRAEQKGGGLELELTILDVIGGGFWYEGVTAKSVKRALDEAKNAKLIRVLINSPGGAVWDGVAIQSLLKRHSARVEIEVLGEAASAASVIAMAGDHIAVHEGAFFMVHEAWTMTMGKAAELRADADLLEKINESMIDLYARRTGRERDEIAKLVTAETWMSAAESLAKGFADEVIPGQGPSKDKPPSKGKAGPARGTGRALNGSSGRLSLDELERLAVADSPYAVLARQELDRRASARSQRGLAAYRQPPPPPVGAAIRRNL